MGQQDNTRISSVWYLHAVPPLSIHVCCRVPNLFWCCCVPVYQLSLLSLPRCAGCSPWAQEGNRKTQPAREQSENNDHGQLLPVARLGQEGEQKELVWLSAVSALGKHVHNAHAQPSCLLKQMEPHHSLNDTGRAVPSNLTEQVCSSTQGWLLASCSMQVCVK